MKRSLRSAGLFILAFVLCRLFVNEVLSRLLHIPKDACYYHSRHAPAWIDQWYMLEGHVEREGNFSMFFAEVLVAALPPTVVTWLLRRKKSRPIRSSTQSGL